MKKDGEEVLQGTSPGMEKLHQKIIGVDIESISYNKIIHYYYYYHYYYYIIIIIIIIITTTITTTTYYNNYK